MAKQRTLQMTVTTTGGATLRKSITYANANATGTVLETFCKKMNGLTTNTYVETDLVDRQPLSEVVAAEAEGGNG